MTVSEQVAANIRTLRRIRNWTAQRFAEECARIGAPKLTASVIANIESGRRDRHGRRRRDVTVDELVIFARVFDMTPRTLLAPLSISVEPEPEDV